jgi:hypothetical protein
MRRWLFVVAVTGALAFGCVPIQSTTTSVREYKNPYTYDEIVAEQEDFCNPPHGEDQDESIRMHGAAYNSAQTACI